MQEKINALKTELLSKREAKLRDLGNSQPIHIIKNEKVCLEENTKDVTD